ncbi:MAG: hypothetical protein ACW99J_15790 [Candidatus Thorarchaeota archaeon]
MTEPTGAISCLVAVDSEMRDSDRRKKVRKRLELVSVSCTEGGPYSEGLLRIRGEHMWLARKKPKKKPRKKRRNAKARYDKEYPVVPIRLPKSFKKQLAKEAEKKDLMISQYIRDLLQGFEIRERIVEEVVEKPVIKTTCDPKKEDEIESLKQIVKRLEGKLLSREAELTEASRVNSRQQGNIASLRESHRSLSCRYEALIVEDEIVKQESEGKQYEIDGLKKSVSSITTQNATLTQEHQRMRKLVRKILEDDTKKSIENARLKRQLEWALRELKSTDKRNQRIAQRIADTYRIRVGFAHASWNEMPER